MKFRKKPVVIEAIQLSESNHEEILKWMGCMAGVTLDFYIETLEGTMRADVGDWIIKGIIGEFYPCKPDIFEATYDKVD